MKKLIKEAKILGHSTIEEKLKNLIKLINNKLITSIRLRLLEYEEKINYGKGGNDIYNKYTYSFIIYYKFNKIQKSYLFEVSDGKFNDEEKDLFINHIKKEIFNYKLNKELATKQETARKVNKI